MPSTPLVSSVSDEAFKRKAILERGPAPSEDTVLFPTSITHGPLSLRRCAGVVRLEGDADSITTATVLAVVTVEVEKMGERGRGVSRREEKKRRRRQ